MTGHADRPGIGLSLPTWPRRDGSLAAWPEIRGLARDAEALGVDVLWVADHLVRERPGRPTIQFRECWTILTAAAEATRRIGVGPLVTCTGFRNPGLLARMAATLDEVSGGRVILALGSGVPATDESWRAFGFDAVRHVGRYAESVEVVARLLRGETVTFAGEHVRTQGATAGPGGPRPGGPPVWVSGKGERTLRIAARWADAVNVNLPLTGIADAEVALRSAASACEAVGRDPATLAVTAVGRVALDAAGRAADRPGWIAGPPGRVADTIRALGEAGIRHVALYLGAADDPSPYPALTAPALDRFAAVMQALEAG
jgi:alkanesulfonate monooxygenase SsuD/methylene tetrahydromethanopterin reductase-like flavin-dependent oxidoreductase (luciferase family)